MKKLMALLTALVLALGVAVAAQAETGEATGTVKMLVAVTGGKDDAEMALFADALGEATGLNIEIDKPASDYDNVLMQKLGAGESYDLIYIGTSQYLSLVQQGALTDLTDYINNSEILTNNVPQSEWDDLKIDGHIYAGFNKREVEILVALNRVMLQNAGIDYQTIDPTLEGYYQVFKALRAANESEDFYPLNTVLSSGWDITPWMAAVGLHGGVVTDSADGKTYAPYTSDASAEVWTWLKKLYDENLLDPSSFVDSSGDMRSKMSAASQQTAVCVDWAAWIGLHNANADAAGISSDDYDIVPLPGCMTPDGTYSLLKGSASLFGVPVNAQNVEGAVKVLEYFATQEGGNLLSIGIEGNDYTVDDQGNYTLTETGIAHGRDHGAPVPIYKDYVFPCGLNRGFEEALQYLEYASVEPIIANQSDYKSILGKWGISIVRGDVSVAEGLQSMRDEMVSMSVCEK